MLPVLVLLSLSAAATPADAPAQPLQVNTRAVPNKVKLGEPFTLEVEITHLKEQRYDLKQPDDSGAFDISKTSRNRVDGKDSATTTFTIQMSGFELGQKQTPQLTFEVATPGAAGTFSTAGVDVEVVGTLPTDADKKGEPLREIRSPVDVAVRTWRLLFILAAVLLAGLAGWALYKYLTRPKPAEAEKPKVVEPLEVRARKALDALAKEDLPGAGRVREYYFRLSEILRGYLGERYGFDAMESTTPELIESLRRLHTPGLPMAQLQEFANESDFVRYAKGTVTPDVCKVALELAYSIVSTTSTSNAQLRVS